MKFKVKLTIPDYDYEEVFDSEEDFPTLISDTYEYIPEGMDYEDGYEWTDDYDYWEDVDYFIDSDNIGKSKSWYDANNKVIFTIEVLGYA